MLPFPRPRPVLSQKCGEGDEIVRCLGNAIETVLRSVSRADGPTWNVLSWEASFDALWKLEDSFVDDFVTKATNVLVIWDRTPAGSEIRWAEYLGPLDWLVALSLALAPVLRSASSDFGLPASTAPAGRVLIWDPGWEKAGPTGKLLRQLQTSNRPLLPWAAVVPSSPGQELVSLLARVTRLGLPSAGRSADPVLLRCLYDLWTAVITRPADAADRHAIANVIGPTLLLGRMDESAPRSPHLPALQRFLEVLGLLGQGGEAPTGVGFPWIPARDWASRVDRLVLVDDLHDQGWLTFLQRALEDGTGPGFPSGGDQSKIQAFRSPEFLLELLQQVGRLDSAPGLPGAAWDRSVLLLDLRLFSRRAAAEEMAFFRRVVETAKTLGMEESDLEAADRCIAAGRRETPDYYAALTLLPRLLARADPFLPIVLFSSTTQKGVVDHLLPYPNIVLDFAKPARLAGDRESVLGDSRSRLQRALDRAFAITDARALCRRVLKPTGVPATQQREWSMVEIFIDESGSPPNEPFAVGGIAILYADPAGPSRLCQDMAERGLTWGVSEDWSPNSPDDEIPDHIPKYQGPETALSHLKKLDQSIQDAGAQVLAFGLVAPPGAAEESIDGLYRTMLREVLEALLFIVLPGHGCAEVPVAIDVATRVSSVLPKWEGGRRLSPEEATRNFGIRFLPKGEYFSLSQDHVYGLVLDVASSREGHVVDRGLCRARGVVLRSFDEVTRWRDRWLADQEAGLKPGEEARRYLRFFEPDTRVRPKQVHYAADCVIRLARQGDVRSVLGDWFKRGFLEDRKSGQRWIDASRADAVGRPAEALALLWEGEQEGLNGQSLRRWVALEAQHWVRALDVNQFRELVWRLQQARRYRAPAVADSATI